MKKQDIILYSIIILIAITILAVGCNSREYSLMLNNLILAGTGIFVAWYTVEACKLRIISDEQLRNSVRPFLQLSLNLNINNHQYLDIKNVGVGPALGVIFEDIIVSQPFLPGDKPTENKVKILSRQMVGVNEQLIISNDDVENKEEFERFEKWSDAFIFVLMEEHLDQNSKKEIIIRYKDLKNNKYKAIFRRNNKIKEGFEIVSQDLEY